MKLIFSPHPLSQVNYDPTGITEALIVSLIVGGATAGITAATTKTPKLPNQPALPNQDKANTDAAATVADHRAVMLASGGQTDYTGGIGILNGSDVSKTSLVGG